jgi:hypothetical protein
MEINPRLFALGFLFMAVFAVVFGTPYLFPHPVVKNTTPNVTIIYKTIEKIITVTPTIDGHIYFASEYQNGTRKLQRPFSWIRSNVTGYKDMKVTVIVYDYKFFDKLHVFNPEEYKYKEMNPSSGTKFCLIFAYVFMDDIIGDDTRMWAVSRHFFAVYDGKADPYSPLVYRYEGRIRELENTKTFNNDYFVQGFKSFREYQPLYSPKTMDLSNMSDQAQEKGTSQNIQSNAGEINDEIYYLRGGQSNAIDGYLIYEIPVEDTPEDLIVLGQFYTFGSSQWKLIT